MRKTQSPFEGDENWHECREVRLTYGPRREAVRVVSGPASAERILRRAIPKGADREHFAVVCLDSRGTAVGYRVVSIGTVSTSLVHPREVFRPAVVVGAVSIIVGHNHPSGDPKPSSEDDAVTRHLVKAGDLLGIKVLDHLVLGDPSTYSYQSAGKI